MKRFFFIALLGAGFTSLAFVSSHTPPVQHFTLHETIAYDTVLSTTCLGEDVHIYGTVEVVHHLTINGKRFVEHVVHIPGEVVGVGLTTGTEWIGAGQTQYTYVGTLAGGQSHRSFVNAHILIGKGQVPNLLMHDNIHATVYADGTVITRVEHTSVECR